MWGQALRPPALTEQNISSKEIRFQQNRAQDPWDLPTPGTSQGLRPSPQSSPARRGELRQDPQGHLLPRGALWTERLSPSPLRKPPGEGGRISASPDLLVIDSW